MFQWHAKVFSKASPNVSSAQRSPWARLHARDLPTVAAPPVCLPASASDWHCLALLHMFIEAIWLIDSPYAVTNIYIYITILLLLLLLLYIVIIMFQYIAMVYCNYCNALYYIYILLITLYTLCYHSIPYHYTMHNMYNYKYIYILDYIGALSQLQVI